MHRRLYLAAALGLAMLAGPALAASSAVITNQVADTNQGGHTVTTHGVFQKALEANDYRRGCLIQNTSADTLLIFSSNVNQPAVADAFKIAASGTFSCGIPGGVIRNVIWITSTATDGATYTASEQR